MRVKILLGAGMLLLGLASDLSADWRSFVWTYEYQTMAKGTAEIEYYLTLELPDKTESEINTWKHQLELEYGITDRWDIALYQQFKQKNTAGGSEFEYDGFKIRTRYRIGERGKYLADPLLYFEYIRNDQLENPDIFEGKLILAKDIGRFRIAYNQIVEQELAEDGETEHGYACGFGLRVTPAFKTGLESKGNYTEDKYYLGPTISLAAGGKLWVATGVVFGLNEESDDLQTRMLVGLPF